jgi:hypothetical protein
MVNLSLILESYDSHTVEEGDGIDGRAQYKRTRLDDPNIEAEIQRRVEQELRLRNS